MKCFLLLLLAFWLPANALFAQFHLLNEIPAKASFLAADQAKRLDPPVLNGTLAETLDQVFDSLTALSPVKGFNAAMLLPDGSYWKRASGLAEAAPLSVPLSTEHLMGMGSITKSFVATTVLLLTEDGLLDLDDSIGQHLDPYPNVPGNVTIRQLLSHRSGINDYLNENEATVDAWLGHLDSIWTPDVILNNFVLEPNFPVNEDWSYSNTNYLLAARIIENVTGQPWYQVVRQRLLEPLDLTHTFAFPWETPGDQPFSHVWADFDGNGTVEDVQGLGLPAEGLFSLASGAGCLLSTPEDLVRFSERLYGGHVLQPATLAEMQTDYVQDPTLGYSYGLGTTSFSMPQNLENWGHNGDLLYKSVALYFPTENMSLAVQQNDDRLSDPDGVIDLYEIYFYLLITYLNYSPVSATYEAGRGTNALRVYPNPAHQSVRLQFKADAHPDFPVRCVLTDANGRVVLSQTLNSTAEKISIGQLPVGVYGLRADGYSGWVVRM